MNLLVGGFLTKESHYKNIQNQFKIFTYKDSQNFETIYNNLKKIVNSHKIDSIVCHSMGCIFGLKLILDNVVDIKKIKRIVMLCPYFETSFIQRFIANIPYSDKLYLPYFVGLAKQNMSSQYSWIDNYSLSSFTNWYSCKLLRDCIHFLNSIDYINILKSCKKCLVILADDDKITPISRENKIKLQNTLKNRFKIIVGLHEPHNDILTRKYISDLLFMML